MNDITAREKSVISKEFNKVATKPEVSFKMSQNFGTKDFEEVSINEDSFEFDEKSGKYLHITPEIQKKLNELKIGLKVAQEVEEGYGELKTAHRTKLNEEIAKLEEDLNDMMKELRGSALTTDEVKTLIHTALEKEGASLYLHNDTKDKVLFNSKDLNNFIKVLETENPTQQSMAQSNTFQQNINYSLT